VRKLLPFPFLLCAGALFAQQSPPEGFSLNSINSLQASQIALSNWATGGESSVSLNGSFVIDARHKKGRMSSELVVNWLVGLFKTEDLPVRKSQDQLTIVAISGYHITPITPNFGAGLLADITTQVAPSYIFNRSLVQALGGDSVKGIKKGDFLSPGQIEVGVGFRIVKQKPLLDLILAPVMLKQTVILDKGIRTLDKTLPHGLYGNHGKTVRSETGAYARLFFRIPLMENVAADGNLKFFANYGDQDLDTSLNLTITGKINRLLSASLHTTLIHDNDVDTDLAKPGKQERVQLREVLGMNLTYAFQL